MGINATLPKSRRTLVATAVGLTAVAGVAAGVVPAYAHGGSHTAKATVLATSLRGAGEVPVAGGPAVGDKDGAALELVQVKGDRVSVAVTWRGTGRPTMLHIHQGAKGTNGGVKIEFTELLKHLKGHSVTGTVQVKDAELLKALKTDPGSFYANLHTAQFPGGAVRGQLHNVTTAVDFRHTLGTFQASVVKGKQIYQCKPAEGGGYAFAQRDVSALLGGGIAHSFVEPDSGTPQWIAPDGSAVTGTVVTKTPNGDGNIPELDLKATRSGKHRGLLARTAEILRLNTVGGVAPTGSCTPGAIVGGVAPTGSCTPGAIVGVPYHADYVFVQH